MPATVPPADFSLRLARALDASLADLAVDTPVAVALSGGSDSCALLLALREFQPHRRVLAFHVCHHLRPANELTGEIELIQSLCLHLTVPLTIHHLDPAVLQAASRTDGIEAAARRLRRAALAAMAERNGAQALLLAHHADDQLETMLLAFLRGGGTGSLGGMRERDGIVRRPLLDVSRRDLCAWRQARGIAASEDSSNADGRFDRNRLRYQVLPALLEAFPSMPRARLRSARRCRADDDCLQELARQTGLAGPVRDGVVRISLPALAALPVAIRERVILQACTAVAQATGTGAGERLSGKVLDQLLDGALPGQDKVIRAGVWLFAREGNDLIAGSSIVGMGKNGYLVSLPVGSAVAVPGFGKVRLERAGDRTGRCWCLPGLEAPVTLRVPGPQAPGVIASRQAWYQVWLDKPGTVRRLDSGHVPGEGVTVWILHQEQE